MLINKTSLWLFCSSEISEKLRLQVRLYQFLHLTLSIELSDVRPHDQCLILTYTCIYEWVYLFLCAGIMSMCLYNICHVNLLMSLYLCCVYAFPYFFGLFLIFYPLDMRSLPFQSIIFSLSSFACLGFIFCQTKKFGNLE